MKVIFVSGKYRASSESGVVANIRKAEEASIILWKAGWAVFCPHKNSALLGGLCPDSVWLDGDIEILKRCDAIYMLSNWQDSDGAKEEYRIALHLGIQIIFQAKS